MNFEDLDDVAAYRALRDALHRGETAFVVGMFFYIWGRLSAYAVAADATSADEDAKLQSKALGHLERRDEVSARRLADDAEKRALAVDEAAPNSLMVVGYWSAISYLFRFLGTAEQKWATHVADSFLSAMDDYSDRHGADALRNEMANLSSAYEAARGMTGEQIVDGARAIVRWASSSPVGVSLPSFASS